MVWQVPSAKGNKCGHAERHHPCPPLDERHHGRLDHTQVEPSMLELTVVVWWIYCLLACEGVSDGKWMGVVSTPWKEGKCFAAEKEKRKTRNREIEVNEASGRGTDRQEEAQDG